MRLQKPWPYKGAATGVILYEGPSMIDGRPIVAVATLDSSNRKTGPMAQIWILRADVSPWTAVRLGADASICGHCPHRGPGGGKGRTCYVVVAQAPLGVWKAYKRGAYPHAPPGALRGRFVRLGAYGDPAALPLRLLEYIRDASAGHTAYTHQWREGFALQGVAMASTETDADDHDAHAMGYRTFRVTTRQERASGFMVCPASEEAGRRLQCHECRACGGADGRRGSVQIHPHGTGAKAAVRLEVVQ